MALDFERIGLSLLNESVAAIKINSTFGPPIYIPEPFSRRSGVPGAPGPSPVVHQGKGFDVGRLLKPEIVLEMRGGLAPVSFAPYGDPGPSRWGVVAVGALAILGLAYVGAVSLLKK